MYTAIRGVDIVERWKREQVFDGYKDSCLKKDTLLSAAAPEQVMIMDMK